MSGEKGDETRVPCLCYPRSCENQELLWRREQWPHGPGVGFLSSQGECVWTVKEMRGSPLARSPASAYCPDTLEDMTVDSITEKFPQARHSPKSSIFICSLTIPNNVKLFGKFPGSPGVRTLLFHCRGCRFDAWLEN